MLMRVVTEEEAKLEEALRAEQEAMIARAEEMLAELEDVGQEMRRAEFGCNRLRGRLGRIVDALWAAPGKSFPQQTGSVAELVALYRFLDNRRVTEEQLLEPHVQSTIERVRRVGKTLVLHDTTGVSLGGKGTREGMGPLNDGGHGYVLHSSLAVSADGQRVPLGVLRYETVVREPPSQEKKKEPQPKNSRKKDPNRESLRWIRGVEQCAARLEGTGTELIHVMDREADDYELLGRMVMGGHRFVVRLSHDRLLALPPQQRRAGEPAKVHEALSQAQLFFEREVELSSRKRDRSAEKRKTYPERRGRLARLQASAMRLSLRRPNGLGSVDVPLPRSIEVNVVRVWEAEPPEGVEPVEWYLLTSESIGSAAHIERVVDFYRARWLIEEFFKALKSGCSLEKRQLENHRSLLNALALFLPMAWRLLLLRTLARTVPALPATLVLSELELHILRRSRPKLALPEKPSIEEGLLAVAALGGHIKHNGFPGWQVIGRGFEKLLSIEEWILSNPDHPANADAIKTHVQS